MHAVAVTFGGGGLATASVDLKPPLFHCRARHTDANDRRQSFAAAVVQKLLYVVGGYHYLDDCRVGMQMYFCLRCYFNSHI